MSMEQADTTLSAAQDTAGLAAQLPELGPLIEPSPVGFHFETVGWTILAVVLLLAILIAAFLFIRRYIHNRYRREALAAMEKIQGEPHAVPQLFALLKRTAIEAFGRDQVSALHGEEWLSFLDRTGKEIRMSDYKSQIFNAIYAEKAPNPSTYSALHAQAIKWVRTHAG